MTRLARFLAGPALASCLFLAGFARSLAAQTNRLNGPLPRAVSSGSVTHHLVSADGTRIVYRADKLFQFESYELFSAPVDGSAPSIRLNDPLRPGARVTTDFEFRSFALASADRVVYLLDRGLDNVDELHVVPLDGSASSTRLTPEEFDVVGFWLTPADEILFRGSGLDLFRVPVSGGTPQGIAFNRFVDRVWVSPDGTTTVFSARRDPTSQYLFRVPTDGSASPVQLDATDSVSEDWRTYFEDLRFAPDGVHILYDAVLDDLEGEPEDERFDLRSATLDGSHPAVTLSQTEALYRGDFAFDPAPGSVRVAFREGGDVKACAFDGSGLVTVGTTPFSEEPRPVLVSGPHVYYADAVGIDRTLHRAPLDGSQPATALMPPAPVQFRTFAIVDSTRLAFIATDSGSFRGLYTVPAAGGVPLLLNPPASPNRGANELVVEPGGQGLVFTDNAPLGHSELYRVPVDGSSSPLLLNAPLLGQLPRTFSVPVSGRVFFHAFQEWSSGQGLYGAPLDGLGPVLQYNEPLLSEVVVGDVTGFAATSDGSTVVYRADQEADESFDLYSAHPTGLGIPVRLTGLLPAALAVTEELGLTPAGERVVFQASASDEFTLWSAPTSAGAAPVELDASPFEIAFPLLTTPDGARAVYTRKTGSTGLLELRSAALDGATPAVTLHPPLPAGYGVRDPALTPDGAHVVYRAGSISQATFELFSVPSDGSAPPVRLHAPLAATRAVDAFRISAAGRRVVFRGDLAVSNLIELWSAPIGGGHAPRKLSGPLIAGGDVTDFGLSPDGRTVVYRADQVADSRFDLFSTAVEGRNLRRIGAPSPRRVIQLTALSGTRRVETDFAFSPDGTQVVYRSNEVVQSDIELFRVPVDGSAAPVRLNAPLAVNGDVRSFAIAPDGSRVVYRADPRVVNLVELSSVPLAGGAAVLLDPVLNIGDVDEYRIDPESARVLYRAPHSSHHEALLAAPLDASAPPVVLNGTLALQGVVMSDFLVLPGGRALYRAQELQRDVLELFVSLDLEDAHLPAARARER